MLNFDDIFLSFMLTFDDIFLSFMLTFDDIFLVVQGGDRQVLGQTGKTGKGGVNILLFHGCQMNRLGRSMAV